MEHYGLLIGLALLVVVTAVAWALGAKANASVRQFREEQHENFVGRKKP